MSECQSKCACGEICRRVGEHLQHQCPKCSYEQRWTAENVAAAPATPAATSMAEKLEALIEQLPHLYIDAGVMRWMMERQDGIPKTWEHANDCPKCALHKIIRAPAAAQPQRGSEQPEQAQWRIEEAFREWWDKHDTATKLRTPQEMTAFQRIKVAFFSGAKAALSPQTDSQEMP